jgi:hypothetical protein
MAEQEKTSLNNNSDESTVYTKKSIGYADGYAKYTQKSAGHNPDGTRLDANVTRGDGEEQVKSTSPELLIDHQSNTFRRINGFGTTDNFNPSNEYEDPTYLIFDIHIMKEDSPLFREDIIKSFMDEYTDAVPEIGERVEYWVEFRNRISKIFSSDTNIEEDGSKKHYIESISNLDVLLNPIINYPEDNIIFTLTEDITMTLQYLSELYNNLVYSYDTHRHLIPDNLLRFNMRITVRDMRNLRKLTNQDNILNNTVNDDVSKFIYVLHDCQFNFFNTKNFGNEMKIAGFGASAISTPASGSFAINFKSYSKITAPLLMDNSKIIDFRERETQTSEDRKTIYKTVFNSDYKSSDDVIAIEKKNNQDQNIKYRSVASINEGNRQEPNNPFQIPEINTSIRGFTNLIKKEIVQVRDVIIKQVYEEVNQLVTAGQRYLGENVGLTIGRVNVYYDSLEKKITSFSHLFEDFLDDTIDNWKGQKDSVTAELRTKNIYGEEPSYNEKYPDSDDTVITDVHEDGVYNEKYPDGDLHEQGIYNEKTPEGDLHDDGQYNLKFPDGDLHVDGIYNEKQPSGNIQEPGQYNEKYPDGDVNVDGTYNDKKPKGNVYK